MLHLMKVKEKILDWENAGSLKLLSMGYSLRPPELLFRKIEDEEISLQVEKLKSNLVKQENTVQHNTIKNTMLTNQPVSKEIIQFDDFAKLELKAGTVIACEKVEKADKLLKLEVDLGSEKESLYPV